MPIRPRRPCNMRGCPNLVAPGDGYCPIHAAAARSPDERPSPTARGYDGRWRRIRANVLSAEPLCRQCLADGRVVVATVVDHIRPLRDGGTHARDNLQPLCESCHNKKSAREGNAIRRAEGEGASTL
jgi:5-methylcytosine-specific restriction enzyme A